MFNAHRRRIGGILLYGAVAGLLIAALQFIEYRYLLLRNAVAIYGGLVAAVFAAAGIWLGLKLTRTRVERVVEVREVVVPAGPDFERDHARLERLGITPRELEILEHMAAGLSNREIAQRLFVSENTVKTHGSRVFAKLNARRRTEAVQRARDARLIP